MRMENRIGKRDKMEGRGGDRRKVGQGQQRLGDREREEETGKTGKEMREMREGIVKEEVKREGKEKDWRAERCLGGRREREDGR